MKRLLPYISFVILLFIWQIINWLKILDPFLFPGPIEILNELYNLTKSQIITHDILDTLYRTLKAFLISAFLGVPIGLILGKTKKIYKNIEFIIDFFRSIPPVAIFPLLLLIFGIGDESKIATAVYATIFIIIFNTAYGVMNGKKSKTTTAQVMGASKWQIFKWIIFWESLPQTFVGLRSGLSLSLILIIVTEMFIGTDIGLGRRIIDSQLIYNIKAMYAAIFVSGIIGYLLNLILLKLEKKYVHWNEK